MRANLFIIEELNPRGGAVPPGGFARFEWDAKHRNIPLRPWSFGIEQRTVRTDYPGADDPTEQVLGPNFAEFSLSGRWDDRYNPQARANPFLDGPANRKAMGGYAKKEREKFEAMVRRGNPVRITFEDITIQGIIKSCYFDYRRSWDIGYTFTFSPHHRKPGGFFALRRSPRTALNATQLRNESSTEVEAAVALHARSPRVRLVDTLYSDVDEKVDAWSAGIGAIDLLIDQQNVSLEVEANTALLRIAAAFLKLSEIGQDMIDLLKASDSGEAMDYQSAIPVLDFDVWSRGLQYQARRIVVVAQRAASELQQRAEPGAMALYRPQQGEHLYSVSNRFYKTPHNWRVIYARNGLSSTTLTGEELLIIPESTGR